MQELRENAAYKGAERNPVPLEEFYEGSVRRLSRQYRLFPRDSRKLLMTFKVENDFQESNDHELSQSQIQIIFLK